MRLSVIGAGNHSALHHGAALAEYRRAHPGAIDLAGVCDLDAAKAAEYARRFGFATTYTSASEMIAREKPDGLIVVTQPNVTAAIGPELLSRRIPLLLEKPPGDTSDQTRALLRAAETGGTPHMVSLNRRYIPAVRKAREWLARRGETAAPRITIARMLRAARREAGFAVGTGIHVIDTVLCLMGAPRRAFTVKSAMESPGSFFFDTILDFGPGRSASIVISPDVGTEEETFEIHGPGYCILIDSMRCSVRILEEKRETLSWAAAESDPFVFRCGSLGETEAFVSAIREGKGFWPTLGDALVSMVACEAVDAGGEVSIPEQRES